MAGSFFAFDDEKNKTDDDKRHRNEERAPLEAAHTATFSRWPMYQSTA